jgi:hypothetical protein
MLLTIIWTVAVPIFTYFVFILRIFFINLKNLIILRHIRPKLRKQEFCVRMANHVGQISPFLPDFSSSLSQF